MKLLLINPPYSFEESPSPPFGLISLAAWLRENGVDVKILDYIVNPLEESELHSAVAEFSPDAVGATAVTMNVKKSLMILSSIKKKHPEMPVFMGGPHVTFDADAILSENPFVDYIIRGEGEITTLELLQTLNDGNLSQVAGISYRENGNPVHNEWRPFIEDINILPLPARDLVDLAAYRALGLPINMVTSRGCPFKCVFCVGSRMVGRKVRYFDVERVVDEFEELSKMGFRQINIVDDLFTSNRERCIKICEAISERGINHEWTAFARVDTVSPDLLDAMRKAGCTTLCFGIESGSQQILDKVKKKINLEMCRKAVDICKDAGISAMTSYILGLPGETPETARQTLEFARSLSPSYGFHILAPFPGTEVREKPLEYGMRIMTDDWNLYDANRSVAESVTMPYREVDRLVGEFNDSIKRYVDGVIEKCERNEQVTESEERMISSMRSSVFAQKVIYGRMIEKFTEVFSNEDSLFEELAGYLSGETGFDFNEARSEVERLYRLNFIKNEKGDNGIFPVRAYS